MVWVVGDAVLNEAWLHVGVLLAELYGPREIAQTWRSVALILSAANVIVPGHGPPLRVTATLIEDLLARFPEAEQSFACPEVAEVLRLGRRSGFPA